MVTKHLGFFSNPAAIGHKPDPVRRAVHPIASVNACCDTMTNRFWPAGWFAEAAVRFVDDCISR
jgi:hypothetical protein